jgi:hypothetical protein
VIAPSPLEGEGWGEGEAESPLPPLNKGGNRSYPPWLRGTTGGFWEGGDRIGERGIPPTPLQQGGAEKAPSPLEGEGWGEGEEMNRLIAGPKE